MKGLFRGKKKWVILVVSILVLVCVFGTKMIRTALWRAKKANEAITYSSSAPAEFKVKCISSRMNIENPYLYIEFSHRINPKDANGYLEIDPDVKDAYVDIAYGGDALYVYGDFKPGQQYTLTALKGMPFGYSEKLPETITRTITMADYNPEFSFQVPGIYMSLAGSKTVPVETMNINSLEAKVHKVYDNNIVYLLNNMGYYGIPDDLGLDVVETQINTTGKLNEKNETLIDLDEILEGKSQGLFYLTIEEPDDYWSRESKLILMSDIGIVAKKSDSDLLVWLNSLSTAQAVSGAKVRVYTKTNQQIVEGITDDKGLIHFRDVDLAGDNEPFVITAATDNDLSFIEVDKCVLSETDFDIGGRAYLSGNYEGFIYSDRGVYRPGETLHLSAIVRGSGVKIPESFPLFLVIKRPDAKIFKKIPALLDKEGQLTLDVAIPDYALTGVYTAQLMLAGSDDVMGSYEFNVEEFMPDRMKVSIEVADKRFKVDEVIPIEVKANHLFGAPAKDRNASITCRLIPVDFYLKKYKSYSFSDEAKSFSTRTLELGEKTTDENGKADFKLSISDKLFPPSSLEISISGVVNEVGGRAVTSVVEMPIDPYPYYIGLRQAIEGYAQINEDMCFDYVTISPEGNKIEVPELKMSVYRVIWDSIVKKDDHGNYRYVSQRREELILEDTINTEVSNEQIKFKPETWGSYLIRLEGTDSTTHSVSKEFYCSGYGYTPWAMERPDKIELKLDKKKYLPGDQAQLTINSPFLGRALVTISKGDIISSQVIDLTSNTQTITLPINVSYAPNAYCAVEIIRSLNPDEEWGTYRAYGIIPLMIDNGNHKLKIEIAAPESIEPHESVTINLKVSDQNSQGIPSSLIVMIVDEGILSLTNFRTPDPFNFFYGKRANDIATSDIYSLLIPDYGKKDLGSDSSPAGDMAAGVYKKYYNPVSAQRVKSVVIYKKGIKTDAQGKAVFTFKAPDFSGSLRVMAVASGISDFGSNQNEIKVIKPLLIRASLPRFLATEDEFIVPVTVFNSTGQDGEVAITLKTDTAFEFLSEKNISINIDNDQEGQVYFKLKSPDLPQKVIVKITASMDKWSDEVKTELAVRPSSALTSRSASGMITAPSETTINLPGGLVKGTEESSFALMSLPMVEFAGGFKYLVTYPYGCIEQTTSATYPLLYLKDLAPLFDIKTISLETIDCYIDTGIEKVLAMQTYSGGFAMWPGYQKPYNWGSIYATDFLVEADKAGYAVPKLEKAVALDYLEKILSSNDEDIDLNLKAYSCYVLAKSGRVKGSWIRRLQEKQDDLYFSSKFYLAASLAILGDTKAVSDILGQGMPEPDNRRETGGSLYSPVKENAIALSIYTDLDCDNPIVPVLVKRLNDSLNNGRWLSTQDNARALLALGKYTKYANTQISDYSGTIYNGQNLLAEFESEAGAKIKNVSLANEGLNIKLIGQGKAYYYWTMEGVPIEDETKEEDKGLAIRRTYFDRKGKELDLSDIKQGQIIVVDLIIKADMPYQNLIIQDLLPAGFEIENPRISSREKLNWIKKDAFEPDHYDIRDDRLLIFTDIYDTEELHYRYIVRAVTKGKFTLPAVSASCMYDPSIKSISGKGSIQIGD
jgi:hypothetical protein